MVSQKCECFRHYYLIMELLKDANRVLKSCSSGSEDLMECKEVTREYVLNALLEEREMESDCGVSFSEFRRVLNEAIDELEKSNSSEDLAVVQELLKTAKEKLWNCR